MNTLAVPPKEPGRGATGNHMLVEQGLRIAETAGEGACVFIKAPTHSARAAADCHNPQRRHGAQPRHGRGSPFSTEHLFGLAGDVTGAGSKVVQRAPASSDAHAITCLKSRPPAPSSCDRHARDAASTRITAPARDTPLLSAPGG